MKNNSISKECQVCYYYLQQVGLCCAIENFTFPNDKCEGFKLVKTCEVQYS